MTVIPTDPTRVTNAAGDDLGREVNGAHDEERAAIMRLCRDASLEMTIHDGAKLEESRQLLSPGTQIYVSHLPRQEWQQTVDCAAQVRACGFEPVPHIPVRKLTSEDALVSLLADLRKRAAVEHVLLIAGDLKDVAGPFDASVEVLETGLLQQYGITRVSFAGHPEGHPTISGEELHVSEFKKARLAQRLGLDASFVTQFTFESAPILAWSKQLRTREIPAKVRIGLAGPARLSTLLKYAMHCGVGPSIRALGGRMGAFTKLIGERGPEPLVRDLARATLSDGADLDGIHLFSFGGFTRTSRWIKAVTHGQFELDAVTGFTVASAD